MNLSLATTTPLEKSCCFQTAFFVAWDMPVSCPLLPLWLLSGINLRHCLCDLELNRQPAAFPYLHVRLDEVLHIRQQDPVERSRQDIIQGCGIYGRAVQSLVCLLYPVALIAQIGRACMVGVPVIQHIAGDPALHKDGCDIIFMVEMLDNYGETC